MIMRRLSKVWLFLACCAPFISIAQASETPSVETLAATNTSPTPMTENDSFPISFRIRPLGLVQGVLGAEAFIRNQTGWFIGPTAFFFAASNSTKQTTISNWELGIKAGRIFYTSELQGFFVFADLSLENTSLTSYYTPTNQIFAVTLSQLSEALFAGYQFRATFFSEHHWDFRLGLGIAYKPGLITKLQAEDGSPIIMGSRKRLDPSMEFTVGYEI